MFRHFGLHHLPSPHLAPQHLNVGLHLNFCCKLSQAQDFDTVSNGLSNIYTKRTFLSATDCCSEHWLCFTCSTEGTFDLENTFLLTQFLLLQIVPKILGWKKWSLVCEPYKISFSVEVFLILLIFFASFWFLRSIDFFFLPNISANILLCAGRKNQILKPNAWSNSYRKALFFMVLK